jgi:hypothetical protein
MVSCLEVLSDVSHQMLQLLKGNDQKKKDEELDDAYNGQTQTNDNEQVAPVNLAKRFLTEENAKPLLKVMVVILLQGQLQAPNQLLEVYFLARK